MKYISVKNIEKFHPGYRDRQLWWAKIHLKMIQGDPDFEMIDSEIDKWRFVMFILLELHNQRPTPIDDAYLTRKGFDLRKRKIDATIQSLRNFVSVVPGSGTDCIQSVTYNREEKSREEEDTRNGFYPKKVLREMFDRIWARYPRRQGKTDAERHFAASVKTEDDWMRIKLALEVYKEHLKKEETDARYIQQGSRWFRNWRDWETDPAAPNEHS